MRRSFMILGSSIIAVLIGSVVVAQTFRGGISGIVTDPTGAVVAAANVQIINLGTDFTRSQETTATGDFSFPDLPVGFYSMTVSKQGFQTYKLDRVEVAVGKVTSLTIQLGVAQRTETVEVQAAATTLETTSTTLNAVVNQRAVQEMPLNGRDFRTLLYLTPGYNQSGSMNGNRPNQNNWQIDGTDNNDFWHNSEAVNQGSISGIAGVLLPIESIDQFNQQAAGGGEFGRNPGSMVNVALRGGTNKFHGSVYYFNRNEFFAEQSPFVPIGSPDKLRNEHEGFSIGGPIRKNRTFFFVNYERQRYVIANQLQATVPSDAWVSAATLVLQKYKVSVNPVMLATLANLWPGRIKSAPATSPNFASGDDNTGESNNGVIKIDTNFGSKHTLSLRAFLGTGEAAQFAGSVYQEYFQKVPSRQHNFAVIWNSTWTPHLVNQLLAGVNYFFQAFDDASHSANPPSWGFNTGVTNSASFGSPNIEISGFENGGVGETPRLGRIDTTGHLTDNLSYSFGSHALKFGGEFRRARLDVFYLREARGAFPFDGSAGPWANDTTFSSTQRALADFIAGYIKAGTASIATGDPQRDYYVNSFETWAQDNWQVTSRLNINYGVRYTYNGRMYAGGSKPISIFLPTAPGGIAVVGKDIDALYPADRNNFAPRVGLAFTPRLGGKVVIRAHYGVFYDIINGNLFIDNRAGSDAGRGVSRNPGGPAPVFSVSNPSLVIVQANQFIFGSATPVPPFAAYTVNQNLRSPYVQNFGIDTQYQVARRVLLQIGYVGNQARKLVYTHNINQILPSTAPPSNSRRPFFGQFPQFRGITEIETGANSHYNALQVSVRTSSWHNLSSQFSYTLGHAIDEQSFPRNNRPTNNYDRRFNRSNADFDYRHLFSGYVVYDVPQLGNALEWLTRGWQLNAFLTADSGSPFTVSAGTDRSNTRNGADRADQVSDPFQGVVQPSIFKNFKIQERYQVQFRTEIFNLFNRLNLGNPVASVNSGSNGLIFGTRHGGDAPGIGYGEPRNVQFVLKFLF